MNETQRASLPCPSLAPGKPRIVLGVIGADCHSVGNKVLETFFNTAGFDVVNVGVLASQNDFIRAAIESNACAILVSSLYGHAEIDCDGFPQKCLERGLGSVLLYVGGNLVVGKKPFAEVEAKFRCMGFDRVFPPSADLPEVAQLLRSDLEARCHQAA